MPKPSWISTSASTLVPIGEPLPKSTSTVSVCPAPTVTAKNSDSPAVASTSVVACGTVELASSGFSSVVQTKPFSSDCAVAMLPFDTPEVSSK